MKAAALVKERGIDASRPVFAADGEFKYGEIYVNVVSDKGIRLIYPPAPAGEGADVLEAQDVDGKYLIKDIIELAKTKVTAHPRLDLADLGVLEDSRLAAGW